MGVQRSTIYRWRDEGILIPERFVILAGKRKLLFDAAVVDFARHKLAQLRQE